jgi:hypothetical protein
VTTPSLQGTSTVPGLQVQVPPVQVPTLPQLP